MPRLDGQDPQALAQAADALRDGALVAFPTETVYGLGARADDAAAVAAIFAAKGRPADHPLIVHVCDAEAAAVFSDAIGPHARALMEHFWPGALTVIVARRPGVAAAAAGGQASIGLRSPSHPVAAELLRLARARGVPGVAAPSANRFGHVSPTTAEHVRHEFGAALWIVDGGACAVGIESSIVDCTRDARPVLLRPGMIDRRAIEAVLGLALADRDAASPRASGTLEVHYAPRARLELMSAVALRRALAELPPAAAAQVAVYSRDAVDGASVPPLASWQPMPATAAGVARELFAVLRDFDRAGVARIWVECPPALPAWEGVLDRLRRAAATRPPPPDASET